MKILYLLLCVTVVPFSGIFAQTEYAVIASNRMVQKHHLPEKIQKIAQIDPQRLQVLWNYFSASFSFNSSETGISVQELLNIQHFDVSEYEHLRQSNQEVQFVYRGSIQITLKSGNELTNLLQGYNLNSLIHEIPQRPFPAWTSYAFSEDDFQSYKKQVWDWARDYPNEYLLYTSDETIKHVRFSDLSLMSDEKKQEILGTTAYIIVD